ncbi:hypothetical protein P9112_007207 [Eukaryota sp. TZLM1-RC]
MLNVFHPTWLVGTFTYASMDLSPLGDYFALGCHTHILIGIINDLKKDIPTPKESTPSTSLITTTRVLFPQNGVCQQNLHYEVNKVRFSPNGQTIALALEGGIRTMSRSSTGFHRPEPLPNGSASQIPNFSDLSWNSSSTRVAGIAFDGSVSIWNVESKSLIASCSVFDTPAKSVSFHPSELYLSVQSDEAGLSKILDLTGVNELSVVENLPIKSELKIPFHIDGEFKSNAVESLTHGFSPDGKYLLYGNAYKGAFAMVLVHLTNPNPNPEVDWDDDTRVKLWYGVTAPVTCIVWSPVLYDFDDAKGVAVFACATKYTEVMICRADQPTPLLKIEKLTYVCDMSWTVDGMGLSFCSAVGHVGLITFDCLDFWPSPRNHGRNLIDCERLPVITTQSNVRSGKRLSSSNNVGNTEIQIKSKRNRKVSLTTETGTTYSSTSPNHNPNPKPNQGSSIRMVTRSESRLSAPSTSAVLVSENGDLLIEASVFSSQYSLLKCNLKSQKSCVWKYLVPSAPQLLKSSSNHIALATVDGCISFFSMKGLRLPLPSIQTSGVCYLNINQTQVFIVSIDMYLLVFDLQNSRVDSRINISCLLSTRQSVSVVDVITVNQSIYVTLSSFESFMYNKNLNYWSRIADGLHVFSSLSTAIPLSTAQKCKTLADLRSKCAQSKTGTNNSPEVELLDSLDFASSQLSSSLLCSNGEEVCFWATHLCKSLALLNDHSRLGGFFDELMNDTPLNRAFLGKAGISITDFVRDTISLLRMECTLGVEISELLKQLENELGEINLQIS